ncbi:hypothetical protein SKAU_G00158020 [Synaphobranchus kaupii]|uniref:Uncharacterized protein n=1 Tax=Synaphobranchus kaupii TaxID=118154 RepID=A0A9Q1FIE4_SYNKA|nr:hypothetical protein SKAU_G00158020 [Synaphobranchus kaupii]
METDNRVGRAGQWSGVQAGQRQQRQERQHISSTATLAVSRHRRRVEEQEPKLHAHTSGAKNTKPDALSRRFDRPTKDPSPDTILPRSVFINAVQLRIEDIVRTAQNARMKVTADRDAKTDHNVSYSCWSVHSPPSAIGAPYLDLQCTGIDVKFLGN